MRRTVLGAMLALVVAVTTARAGEPQPRTEEEKTIYAIGLAMSQNLGAFSLSEKELALVQAGLADGVLKKEPKVDLKTFGPKITELASARAKKAAQPFLDKAAAEKGAKKSPSGLIFSEIQAGEGDSPKATDTVKVTYRGTLTDGTVFDSSEKHGGPATFPLNGVIKCWTEGLQMMKVGGKAKLVCPADIAYGDRGQPAAGIQPGAPLVFEVELLEIVKK